MSKIKEGFFILREYMYKLKKRTVHVSQIIYPYIEIMPITGISFNIWSSFVLKKNALVYIFSISETHGSIYSNPIQI